MKQWADRRVDTYSKGMMQRVGVAQSLINDPQLVVLDEPTDGVDPIGRQDIRAVLLRLRDEGRTVFINSHLLSELEVMCDRVAIMVLGQVVRQRTIGELAAKRQWYELELTGDVGNMVKADLNLDASGKGQMGDGIWLELSGGGPFVLRVGTADPLRIQPLLDGFRQKGCIITRMETVRPSLESLFMEAVAGGEVRA